LDVVSPEELNQIKASLLVKQIPTPYDIPTRILAEDLNTPIEQPNIVFPSNYLFERLYYWCKERCPSISDDYAVFLKYIHPRVKKYVSSFSRPQLTDMVHQFYNDLEKIKEIHATTALPTVVWDKSASIHFCNQPFRDLTGFELSLPTPSDAFTIYSLFSVNSLRRIISIGAEAWTNPDSCNQIIPCEILVQGKHVHCMLNLEVRRYSSGIPMLHVAHLIPVVSTPVLEIGKASMLSKPFYTADFQDDNIIDFQLPKPSPTVSKADFNFPFTMATDFKHLFQ